MPQSKCISKSFAYQQGNLLFFGQQGRISKKNSKSLEEFIEFFSEKSKWKTGKEPILQKVVARGNNLIQRRTILCQKPSFRLLNIEMAV